MKVRQTVRIADLPPNQRAVIEALLRAQKAAEARRPAPERKAA